ncbi:MAG TPA: hypothetical protein VI749_01920 [Candidatus Omnitrophota bacterium]|nr:hypothetical protein [Candidatus Omnitrophota bacterium]
MRNRLIIISVFGICLLSSNACFADIVHFNNGFTYEGEVTQDAQTGGYWIDGALVSKSEIKDIEKKEADQIQGVKSDEQKWYEELFSAISSFNVAFQKKMKGLFNKEEASTGTISYTASRVSPSRSYVKPAQTTSSQAGTNYNGTASSVWQNLRRSASTGATSAKSYNAGNITKRDRNKVLQELKRNSAGYALRNERLRNKTTLSSSKQNSAGYALSRQRAAIDRELSSFGGSNTKY